MKTGKTITADDLAAARAQLRVEGLLSAIDRTSGAEPELFGFIMASINCVAGRLSLAETPNAAVRATAEEMFELVLTCLMAERQHRERTE